MTKFKINHSHTDAIRNVKSSVWYPPAPWQLIPNPDGIQPVEWCQTCGREDAELFWNGFQTICTFCDKDRAIRRRLKVQMVDNGIPLDEFYYRLYSRIEAYGLD